MRPPDSRATSAGAAPRPQLRSVWARRESHDAGDFYARFVAPEISDDDEITRPVVVDEIWDQDARSMTQDQVADNSVALVVTSPPYFAGKDRGPTHQRIRESSAEVESYPTHEAGSLARTRRLTRVAPLCHRGCVR